jgi:hypothetical protein
MSGIGGVTGSASQINNWLLGRSVGIGKSNGPVDADGDHDGTVAGLSKPAPSAGDTKLGDLRAQILDAVRQAIGSLDPSAGREQKHDAIQSAVDGVLKANGIDRSQVQMSKAHRHHHHRAGTVQAAPAEATSQDPIATDPTEAQLLGALSDASLSDSDAGRFLQQFLAGAPAGTQLDLQA